MEWRDQGIVLSTRHHGESSVILECFTPGHGRHVGVVRGGASRRMAPLLQPGAQVDLVWQARLEDHVGSFRVEPIRSRAAVAMADRTALAGLNAVVALLRFCLPERAPHLRLYDRTEALLDFLGQPGWAQAYLGWEVLLLEDMGFGLDLSTCAVLGAGANDLSFVSPRTGRAVSRRGAGEWADRLLPLPPCLLGEPPADAAEMARALAVTGHFLHNHLAPDLGNTPLPEARARLLERLA